MATIQNDRDLLLQAASPRVVLIPIPIDRIEGLPQALRSLRIKSSATTFVGSSGATNPATITLTAEKLGGLAGAVTWSVIDGTGTLTPSGDSCTVTGSTVVGSSITVRARVTVAGTNYDAQVTLTKLGSLSAQETINLTNQVVGQLAMGNVTGYGALALLNQVNLNTQTIGALNGQTQVTNLGNLAYVNALAANQIGAGTLAAGVIYAGTVNVENLVGTTISGKNLSGSEFIYMGGTSPGNSPMYLTKIGTDEALFSMRGSLEVGRTDHQSTFAISSSNNLTHGSITTGVTATFRGSSFNVYSQGISAPTFQTSSATGVIARHDSVRLLAWSGANMLTAVPARVTIGSGFLNIRQVASDPGGSINGDMTILNNTLLIKLGGVWNKVTTTPI